MTNTDYILELLEEANISIACMMDEINDITMEDLGHIQDELINYVHSTLQKSLNGNNDTYMIEKSLGILEDLRKNCFYITQENNND
jgi:hypothetical protein